MDLWEIAHPFGVRESSVQQPMQQMMAYHPPPNTSTTLYPVHNSSPSVDLFQPVVALIERQMQDMDRYLRLKEEELRVTIMQWKQHQESLVQMIQSRAVILLQQKEHEVMMASKRTLELEQLLKKTENEKILYEQSAKMYEATALALNKMLTQVSNPCYSTIGALEVDDAASCSAFPRAGDGGGPKMREGFGVCKSCNARKSSMLLIPCQHLCSCEQCEPSLCACPVCGIFKTEGIEVFYV